MKCKFRAARSIILLFLVFTTLMSCVVTAGAIGWSGSSTSGGVASSSQDGKYSISGSTAIKSLVGYRFAAIKADGSLANIFIESLDVFIEERESYLDNGKWARMVPQYSKKRYFDTFGSASATSPSFILDAQSMTGGTVGFVKKESAMGFKTALPGRDTSDLGKAMNTWQDDDDNLDIIARALGYSNGISSMQAYDTITVEPIFAVEIDNENLCLTVTEMAYYGGQLYGWNNKGYSNSSDDGSDADYWGYIGKYTNRYFGNALYNDEELGLGWTIVTTSASSRVSFRTCIQYGYGVGICYKKDDSRPDLECVEIFFVDKNLNVYADPMKLPAGKSIYAVGVFRNNSGETKGANFYYMLNNSETALTSSQMMFSNSYSPSSDLNNKYMAGGFTSNTALSKYTHSMLAGETRVVVLSSIATTTSGTTGYVHAQTWLQGKTSATTTTSVESNIANNYKKVQYKFVSEPKRDVGIEVLLTDAKGPFDGVIYTDTQMKSLPYGSVVQVWHKYYTNNGSNYPSIEYVNGYDQNSAGVVRLNGDTRIAIKKGEYTYVLVTAFRANSFSNVTRYGYVSLAGAGYKVTTLETNGDNNSDSITWAAKCDVELYQIVLEQLDANGSVVATWTRTQGQAETNPSIPYGAIVRIKYVYKNNSQDVVYVDGYKSTTISTGNKFGSNYAVNANGGTKTVTYGTFIANASGTVYGAVRVNGYTGTGPETNANNNSLSFGYTVTPPKDLAVKQIQYVYRDKDNVKNTITIPYGSQVTPVFPRNVTVSVWVTFQNNATTDLYIDGYYTIGSDTSKRILINNSTNVVDQYLLPAGTEKTFFVKNFTATELGDGTYVTEVYQDGKTTAAGENNTANNVLSSSYTVYGDVGIEIYFTDKNNNKVNPAEFWHTQEYKVWLKVTNYTPFSQSIDIYYKGSKIKDYTIGASGNDPTTYSFVAEAPTGSSLPERLGTHSVNAAVYFDDKTSAAGECDINGVEETSNNNASKDFVIKAEVGIKDIIYKDENDVVISDPMKIKEGTKVKVYYKCTNDASVDVNVWLKYNGTKIATAAILPAGTTGTTGTEVFVTEFTAAVDGSHEIVGEVYRVVNNTKYENAEGETNPNNNVYESSYGVISYDVEIVDIFYMDDNDVDYGRGDSNEVTLLVGRDYTAYYTIKNQSNVAVSVHAYSNKDLTADGVYCISESKIRIEGFDKGAFESLDTASGIELEPGASISFEAGTLCGVDQQIGITVISGSTYIVDDEKRDIEQKYDNNVLEETIKFVHNVSLDEIYLTAAGTDTRYTTTDSNGRVMIPAKAKVDVHYVLTNHSGKPITVNIYNYLFVKMTTGLDEHFDITIPANETIDVLINRQLDASTELTVGSGKKWTGYVYRVGYDPAADPYELTFEDNSAQVRFVAVETPYLEFINPNAPYREGTDVITSYYLYNPTAKAYNGEENAYAEVKFTVKIKKSGEEIYTVTQPVIVPSFKTTQDTAQLVYFKWSVPEDYLKDTDKFEVCAELCVSNFPGMCVSSLSNVRDYVLKDNYFTPDTEYEEKEPDGWTKPTETPVQNSQEKYWSVWYYENNQFVQTTYALRARMTGSLSIKPDDVIKTDYERYPNHWVMRSGYGVQVEALADSGLFGLRGYSTPTNDMFTWSQYSYMIWPEFQYEVDYELPTISTLVKENGKWTLPIFENPDKNKVYGPVHFTPLWYPDGNYTAYACHSDIWTPMGMMTVGTSDFIEIEGSAYDDWWIGHGIT